MIFSFSSSPLFSSLLFSSLRFASLFSSLLYFLFSLLSLSSFSVSVFVCWWCVCVSSCVCVVVWCGVVCAVWCGTLKTPCVDSKRFPCVDSNVPVYAGNTRTCFSACGRGANTHGKRFESTHGGHRQFCLPRTAHVGLSLGPTGSPKVTTGRCPCSSLRKDREQHVPDSSNHSHYLIKLLSSSYPGETLEGTSREMVRFVFRSHDKSITNDLRVRVSPDFALLTVRSPSFQTHSTHI